ncbi:MAG: hypothetical protein IJ017_04615 [Oscillospiraceae bacterium]|nr:hypothetical protein [Oscillospiraceae bacterium]
MEVSWLLGLVHEKHRDTELYKALGEFYEKLSNELKKEFKKTLKSVALMIDHKEAREIVARMEPHGEKWNVEVIKKYLSDKAVHPDKELHYYLIMNMAYNDYKHTAEKFDVDNTDFYYCIAHDFIEDPDAKDFKVEKYFM